jgi:Uma2 family endonuclease
MVVRARTVEEIMLEEPDRFWEVHRGRLREKPAMSESHNRVIWRLIRDLSTQLDPARFEARVNMGRVRYGATTYYIPDIYVVPVVGPTTIRNQPYKLEVFDQPLPLVVEGWSPSTGGYDVNEKLPEYKGRGDREIWRLHVLDFALTAWRRQPDGTYVDTIHHSGKIVPIALPGVVFNLDDLFA